MQSLAPLIAKYTKPPYNNTPEDVEEWWKSHRSLGAVAANHKKKTKKILKPKPTTGTMKCEPAKTRAPQQESEPSRPTVP